MASTVAVATLLWPGCEDVYSTGNNDSNFNQGPREDIIASEGLFWSTGSFFDPGSTGSQTNNSTTYENRLMIEEAELSTAGADYFLDSWYVVQYDVGYLEFHGLSLDQSVSVEWWLEFRSARSVYQWSADQQLGFREHHRSMESHEIVRD